MNYILRESQSVQEIAALCERKKRIIYKDTENLCCWSLTHWVSPVTCPMQLEGKLIFLYVFFIKSKNGQKMFTGWCSGKTRNDDRSSYNRWGTINNPEITGFRN